MKMTFYTANCRGNAKNSLYPNKHVVDNEDDCMEVMAFPPEAESVPPPVPMCHKGIL